MSKKTNPKKGQQLELIEVLSKVAKPIIEAAIIHKDFMTKRLSFLAKEKAQKIVVLELVKAAKLQPLEGGVIKFASDGFTISVTPRDELIRIKKNSDSKKKKK